MRYPNACGLTPTQDIQEWPDSTAPAATAPHASAPLNEEDDATRYKREGWDPRKTHEENMTGAGLYADDGGQEWPELEPAPRRSPSRQVRELAAEGRGEDTEVAHVARGELVVPQALQTPDFMAALTRAAAAFGVPLERLRIGNARNSINPNTGAPEFWFEGLTPDMEDHATRVTHMPIPIDPLSGNSRFPLTGDLFPPRDTSQPIWNQQFQGPQQYMGPARPATSPMQDIINDPRMMPSLTSQAIASLPTDRETQKRALANAVFPPPYKDQTDRFFENNGRLAFTNWDGKKYYAEPAPKLPTSMQNLDETVKWAGSQVGPLMDDAGRAIGGAVGSRGGLGAAVGGYALGGSVGDIARQFAANRLANEQKPWDERVKQNIGAVADGFPDALEKYLRWKFRVPD